MIESNEGMKMQDKIEITDGGSIIQHGKLNDRVYLMKLNKNDFPGIIDKINQLGKTYSYTKFFCKVPFWASPLFIADGFIVEAQIPFFYNNKVDVFFMSKFVNHARLMNLEYSKFNDLSGELISYHENSNKLEVPSKYQIKHLQKDDADEIGMLYKKVFKSYPFPIYDPEYIRSTMKSHVQYFGVKKNGQLIALASAEVDKKGKNAEMTDFATLPDYRGNNLSVILLDKMENVIRKQGITTLYTIARLNSIAMNKTFLKLSYKYAGTLINNTNISGKIESMNVYYKHI